MADPGHSRPPCEWRDYFSEYKDDFVGFVLNCKIVNYQVSVVSSLYVITGETCYLR